MTVAPSNYENPVIKKFLESRIDALEDDDVKKVIAAGTLIAQRRQSPDGNKQYTTEDITQMVDGGVSAVKVVYKVSQGEIDPRRATDVMVDCATAATATIITTGCERAGAAIGEKVGAAIGRISGSAGAAVGAGVGAFVGRAVGRLIGEALVPAVKKVANVAKEVIHHTWEGVKKVAGAVWGRVKGFFSGLFG